MQSVFALVHFVHRLHVDCNQQSLQYIPEKLSLDLYYRLLSHRGHPLNTDLLNTKDDILYQDRPSCIPCFNVRMGNLFDNSPLCTIEVRPYDVCSILLMNLIKTISIPLSSNNCLHHIVQGTVLISISKQMVLRMGQFGLWSFLLYQTS